MNLRRTIFALAFAVGLASPLAAQESGNFVVRLGRDTTAIETYTRTGNRLVVEQVGRAPRVLKRHYEFDLNAAGATTRASATITSPTAAAGAPPVQQIDATFTGDSLTMESKRDTTVQRVRLALPAGLVANAGASPWTMYEQLSVRMFAGKLDSLRLPMYALGGTSLTRVTVAKLGRDSIAIQTENDRYHAQVDRAGRIQHVVPIWGTVRVNVDRAAKLDFPGLVASFTAREQQGAGLGALSTRDTARAEVGGAKVWVDYGRPAKRGRTIFGNVVPFGELWRTGANAATQLGTDQALEIGGVVVPAGTYTLWTIPSPGGWKLIINSEAGITGTAHKAEKDLHTLDMKVASITEPVERFTIRIEPGSSGGVIHMEWDTTRASIPFTVKR
jgi:hypothetical protein